MQPNLVNTASSAESMFVAREDRVSMRKSSVTVFPLDSPYTPMDEVKTIFPPPLGPCHLKIFVLDSV